jgi:Lecithin retinol acyltransferase
VHIAQSQTFTTRRDGFLRRPFDLEQRRRDPTLSPSNQAALCRGDRLLAAHEEPPLGAHLVTPRFAYAHHGVYVGGGAVVHYAAFAKHWHRGPVEETSLTHFAHRHPVWVRAGRPHGLQSVEIVRRARSRLGEDRYRFFSNNCEHFSEWCVNGEHRSPQVERLLAPLRCVSRALNDLLRLLKATPLRGGDCRCARPT